MRRDLAGHVDAARLALPHGFERSPGAHVGDVDPAAGHLGEEDVSCRSDGFGRPGNAAQAELRRARALVRAAIAFERRVLAVLDERHVEHAGVLERPARQQRRRHRMTIVRDGDASGSAQLGDVGELLTFLAA